MLDEYVGDKVLEALKPAALELSLEAAGRVEQDRAELDELWQKRLERAAYEADRAGRHYRQIEPENRLVGRQLARDWEDKLAAHQRLEEDYRRFQNEQPKVLSDAEREAIRRLSEDIPALWQARTTTNRDRKEIVRQIIERIVIGIEADSERVEVEIRWAGDVSTKDIALRPVQKLEQLSYYPDLCKRLRELVEQGVSRRQITDTINAEGYRPPGGEEKFGFHAIAELLKRLGLTNPRRANNGFKEPVLNEDEWCLSPLAAELGMHKSSLRAWVERGWVQARQEQRPPWRWIVWADEEELERLRELRALPRGYHVRNKLWVE